MRLFQRYFYVSCFLPYNVLPIILPKCYTFFSQGLHSLLLLTDDRTSPYPIFIHVCGHLYIPKWLSPASRTGTGSSFWLETHPQWITDRFGMWILQLWHIDFKVSLASLQLPQREAFQGLNIEMVKLFIAGVCLPLFQISTILPSSCTQFSIK